MKDLLAISVLAACLTGGVAAVAEQPPGELEGGVSAFTAALEQQRERPGERVDEAWAHFLSQGVPEAVEQRPAYFQLIQMLQPHLSEARRAQLRTLLEEAVTDARTASLLRPQDVMEIRSLRIALGGELGGNWATAWTERTDAWRSAGPDQLARLLAMLRTERGDRPLALREQVAAVARTQYLSDASAWTSEDARALMSLLAAVGWASDAETAAALAGQLEQVLTARPEVLAALGPAELAVSRRFLERHRSGASSLDWPSVGRQWLERSGHMQVRSREELVRVQRLLRRVAYADFSDEQWQSALAQQARTSEGDTAAYWYLARAYAAEKNRAQGACCGGGGGISARTGLPWLRRAFAVAESEPMRLAAVTWIVSANLKAGYFDRSWTLLASVREQFQSDEAKRRLLEVEAEIETARKTSREQEQRLNQQQQRSRLAGRVVALRRHLERLQDRDADPEALRSVEQLIAKAERQLARAAPGG